MRINIKVIANSSKDKIEKIPDGLKIHLKEKAVKGKANKALIELLSDYLRCRKSQIKIIKGLTSSRKIIEIMSEIKDF